MTTLAGRASRRVSCTEAIAGLAPHLPPSQLAQVLTAATAIADEYSRASVLAVLASHLPPEQLARALAAANAIADDGYRTWALAGLVPMPLSLN